MSVVFTLDGSVISVEKLNQIRKYLEEEAKSEYKLKYDDTRITNLTYHKEFGYYTFSIEFLR